ncbi:MAG: biopolymer transporter ExbD [bacterium]|jgi:biopolymer transport protein ExbD|nr:biopolymer transporter ExbD [candidate division KSB1 bacterium]MDH7559653.1 biopolymer transporter ExbD [bacterium]
MNLSTESTGWQLFPTRRRSRTGSFTLRLTSMIDMFTILLVFLLKSYSAEGQIMTIARDLRLPQSTATLPPKTTSIVALTREWILLDGRPIVRNADVLARSDLVIAALLKELQDLRALTEGIGQLGAVSSFAGNITIQGDKSTPFELLKRVMVTCGRMGYNDMNLAVLRTE